MASATSKEQTNSDECSTLPERCTEEVLSTTSKMVVVTQKMIKAIVWSELNWENLRI